MGVSIYAAPADEVFQSVLRTLARVGMQLVPGQIVNRTARARIGPSLKAVFGEIVEVFVADLGPERSRVVVKSRVRGGILGATWFSFGRSRRVVESFQQALAMDLAQARVAAMRPGWTKVS